jgi:hypothetical protein
VKYFTLSKKLMTMTRRFFCLATAAKTGKPGPSIAVEDRHKLLRWPARRGAALRRATES